MTKDLNTILKEIAEYSTILKAVAAYSGSPDNNCGCDEGCDEKTQCAFCHTLSWGETHEEDCIVLLARRMKDEQV